MRVVAGTYKRHPLATPPGADTRPTSDRVRESVFGSLETLGMVDGATVCDLCAGSGALGIEALSRGAGDVVFVERAARALATIEKNLATLGESRRVIAGDATGPVAGLVPGSFDLVLADPPYPMSESDVTRLLTHAEPLLRDAASLIVLERSTRSGQPHLPDSLRVFRTRVYGETAMWFLERATIEP